MALADLLDDYNRRARLMPALLIILPAGLLVIAAVPTALSWWGRVVGLAVASGLPFFITQIVRDRGRTVEPELFESWGGPPTTCMLRWSGNPELAVRRRHELLSRAANAHLPSADEEQAEPTAADQSYAIAVAVLRERTRERSRFPLVYQELTAYGFRRNTYACRSLGLLATGAAAVAMSLLTLISPARLSIAALAALLAFNAITLLAWLCVVSATWVHRAAESYARQLLASLETLTEDRSPKTG